jgi:hypothetical protein
MTAVFRLGRPIALLLPLVLTATSLGARSVTLEVAAGAHDRGRIPVSFALPRELEETGGWRLSDTDSGRKVPVQVEDGRVWWILDEPLRAGSTRRYTLTAGNPAPFPPGVEVRDEGGKLLIRVGNRRILQYNEATVPSPDPKAPYFERSGHIHPLWSPSGKVLTDEMPADHLHQHAVFFAWVNTTFEGHHVDFWNSAEKQGKVEHARVLSTTAGPVFGAFRVELRHIALLPDGPKTALNEVWTVRAFNLPDRNLFDLESVQTCASESPLIVNEYHYGGMGVRGNEGWNIKDGGGFLTSDGKTRADGNHTRPRWCDLYGPVGGDTPGITAFDHPSNFRFPQPVRIHPSMPYFCFAPMVLGEFRIEPGTPYRSAFRFDLHDGPVDPALADRAWADYGDPPSIRVLGD